MKKTLVATLAALSTLMMACNGGKTSTPSFSSLAGLNVKTICIIVDPVASKITTIPDSIRIVNDLHRIQWIIVNVGKDAGKDGLLDVVIDHFERSTSTGDVSDHDPFAGSRFSSGAIAAGDLSDSQMSGKAVPKAKGGNFKYHITATKADSTTIFLDPVLIVD